MSLRRPLTAYWLHIQRGTSALARRYDVRPAEWTSPATGQRSEHGPDRGVSGRLAWPSRASAVRARRPGEGLYREGRIQHSDHQPADRDAVRRQDVAQLMWLAARGRGAERVDVFAGFRGVRRERFAIAVARTLIQDTHSDRLVGHISRDSTAIEAREKPAKSDKPAAEPKPKPKRGRPRRGAPPAAAEVGSNVNGA